MLPRTRFAEAGAAKTTGPRRFAEALVAVGAIALTRSELAENALGFRLPGVCAAAPIFSDFISRSYAAYTCSSFSSMRRS